MSNPMNNYHETASIIDLVTDFDREVRVRADAIPEEIEAALATLNTWKEGLELFNLQKRKRAYEETLAQLEADITERKTKKWLKKPVTISVTVNTSDFNGGQQPETD